MNDKIDVQIGNSNRTIFMSYGLLNTLTAVLKEPLRVLSAGTDKDLRDSILREALAERNRAGKIIGDVPNIDEVEISIADVEKLLDWVSEHVMGFFLRRIKSANESIQKIPGIEAVLQSSEIGSESSAGAKA